MVEICNGGADSGGGVGVFQLLLDARDVIIHVKVRTGQRTDTGRVEKLLMALLHVSEHAGLEGKLLATLDAGVGLLLGVSFEVRI